MNVSEDRKIKGEVLGLRDSGERKKNFQVMSESYNSDSKANKRRGQDDHYL